MEVTLQAEPRTGVGKGVARKIRAAGKVPGVVYGQGMAPASVAVDARLMLQALHTEAGRNVLIGLELDGDTILTMPREVQRHPVRGTLIHVDFLKIDRFQMIEVEVPIHVHGESVGVKEGGVIEHHIWSLSVRCLPTNVPERMDADVSNIGVGDTLRVEAIPVPEGVEMLTPLDEIIVSCVVPQKVEEPVAAPVEGEEAVAVEGEEAAAETKPEES